MKIRATAHSVQGVVSQATCDMMSSWTWLLSLLMQPITQSKIALRYWPISNHTACYRYKCLWTTCSHSYTAVEEPEISWSWIWFPRYYRAKLHFYLKKL